MYCYGETSPNHHRNSYYRNPTSTILLYRYLGPFGKVFRLEEKGGHERSRIVALGSGVCGSEFTEFRVWGLVFVFFFFVGGGGGWEGSSD